MAAQKATSGRSPGNPPTIIVLVPDVVMIGPDYSTGGVAVEVFDATANTACRTLLDVGAALEAALRMVGAAVRLPRGAGLFHVPSCDDHVTWSLCEALENGGKPCDAVSSHGTARQGHC